MRVAVRAVESALMPMAFLQIVIFLAGPKQLLSYVPMNIVLLKKKDNCCIPEKRFCVECSMSIAAQGLASSHQQLRAVCPTPLIKQAS